MPRHAERRISIWTSGHNSGSSQRPCTTNGNSKLERFAGAATDQARGSREIEGRGPESTPCRPVRPAVPALPAALPGHSAMPSVTFNVTANSDHKAFCRRGSRYHGRQRVALEPLERLFDVEAGDGALAARQRDRSIQALWSIHRRCRRCHRPRRRSCPCLRRGGRRKTRRSALVEHDVGKLQPCAHDRLRRSISRQRERALDDPTECLGFADRQR